MLDLRLIATDIDGTLANAQGALTPFTLRVLRALLDEGVPVTLVTGYNPWPARRYVDAIGRGVRAIALNGIFLLENGEVHEGKFLDPQVVRAAAALMSAQGYTPLVYGADGITRYWPGPDESLRHVRNLIATRPYQPYEAVESFEALFAVRPAQVSVCDTEGRCAQLYAALEAAVGECAYVVFLPGTRAWVEVNHVEARKDVALLALAARLGAAPAEIVYFGDSLNDLPVFKVLPHAVAMGNACPEVKSLAWRIAPTNDEDGVAQVLVELFGLV